METNRIYLGNTYELLDELPEKSVDCVITSPPYFLLRAYAELPDYELANGFVGQLGHEPTFGAYIDNLALFMSKVWRVLKDTGCVFCNIGDTFGGSHGFFSGINEAGVPDVFSKQRRNILDGVPTKCKLMIPARFAIRCIDDGWTLRNEIIYWKVNCTPESVTDRFSKRHESLFLLVKQPTGYYFDLDAVRERAECADDNRKARTKPSINIGETYSHTKTRMFNPKGKNPGDVWQVVNKGGNSDSKHFAAFSSDFVEKPILAGCPEGGLILDPFAGTGTTLIRAYQLGRQVMGFEGSPLYHKQAESRLNALISQSKLF